MRNVKNCGAVLFIENNEGVKSASLFFVGQMFLYVKRNERLHQKVAHAESCINNKSIAASVPCDGFHMIRWRRFLRYRGVTSKSYTGYPQIPELPDSLLAQTSNQETQLSATPVTTI